jgi:Helicase conserved C-terminal domain
MLTLHFIPSTHFRPPLFILTPFHPIFCPERFLTYGTWQRTRRELTSWLCWTMWYHATLSRNTELSSSATQSSPAGKSILLSLSMSSRWWSVQSQRWLQRAILTTTSSYAHTSSLTSMPYYPSINVSISPHSSHLLLVFSEPLSMHCQALESKFLVTMETSTRKRGQCYLFKHTLLRSTPVHAVVAYYWDIGIRLRVTAGCDTSTPLLFSVTPYSMMPLKYLLHPSYTTERSQLFFPSHNSSFLPSFLILLPCLVIPCLSFFSHPLSTSRQANLDKFREGEQQFLVCTDLAARGLDIPEIDHVIMFDFPLNPVDYIHR